MTSHFSYTTFFRSEEEGRDHKAGRCLRVSDMEDEHEKGEWKPVLFDEETAGIVVPNGTMGQRHEEGRKWNLKMETDDGTPINPALSILEQSDGKCDIDFPEFDNEGNSRFTRPIPYKSVELKDGSTVK